MEKQELQQRAETRVDARLGLYTHASVFVGVNALLWFINIMASPEYLWAIWPTLGWGIGLVVHITSVVLSQRGITGVRDRMIEHEVERLDSKQKPAATH